MSVVYPSNCVLLRCMFLLVTGSTQQAHIRHPLMPQVLIGQVMDIVTDMLAVLTAPVVFIANFPAKRAPVDRVQIELAIPCPARQE